MYKWPRKQIAQNSYTPQKKLEEIKESITSESAGLCGISVQI